MRDRVEKYLCLEDSCKGEQALSWINFFTHQRVLHLKQWIVHFKTFTSIIEFQVWCKFVQETILKLTIYQTAGNSISCLCHALARTSCPARIIAKRKTVGNDVHFFVIYMGEHYGHDHTSNRAERLFLLDYRALAMTPMDEWLLHFRDAGVFLQTQSTPVLREMAEELALESLHMHVVGFMNTRQMLVLKEFQFTVYLEDQGKWIVLYSIVKHRDDYSKPPLALPVAYCYSNFMYQRVVSEFFGQLRKICGSLNSNQVITNNIELFERPWNRAFPESDGVFMQSWQTVVKSLGHLIPNQLNYDEIQELGKILKKSVCKEYPNPLNITNDFLISVRLSEKLHRVSMVNLLQKKHHFFLGNLIEEWIEELEDHKWVKSYHERMFLLENSLLIKAIMKDANLPKVMMHLTIFSNNVHNTSPQLFDLEDFVFKEVSAD